MLRSSMNTQTLVVERERIFFVEYPISTAVSKTSCLVSSLMSLAPFNPLETVLTAMPRRSAMSLMVGICLLPFCIKLWLLRAMDGVSARFFATEVLYHKKPRISTKVSKISLVDKKTVVTQATTEKLYSKSKFLFLFNPCL